MINVLLVDDHHLVRHGIKKLLEDVKGIKVVGEASSGEEAITMAKSLEPNVILMDVKMEGIGGMEATRLISRAHPDIKILGLSSLDDDPFPTRMLQYGAVGYLTKGAAIDEMVRAIKAVNLGQRYISPEIAQKIAIKHLTDAEASPFDLLSERELSVAMMIIDGVKAADIAEQLHLSGKTVNSYRYRIFEKLGIQTDVELIHMALRYGMVTDK